MIIAINQQATPRAVRHIGNSGNQFWSQRDSEAKAETKDRLRQGRSGAKSLRANASSKSGNCSGFTYDDVAGRAKRQGEKAGRKGRNKTGHFFTV